MHHFRPSIAVLALLTSPLQQAQNPNAQQFAVTFPAAASAAPLDGRLLLLLSKSDAKEPREQVTANEKCAQLFGIDVDGWRAGTPAVFDGQVFGYPCANLAAVPPGDYFVQALLNRYETFRRADGRTLKLPPDRGEGQQWNKKPGNLYSKPQRCHVDPGAGGRIEITLDSVIAPIAPVADSKYIKHVKISSDLLSEFWGRPMELGACVLLPEGFDEHPQAHYPLVVFHGHFPATFGGFREAPPDPDLKPDFSERFQLAGYNRIEQEQAHEFFKTWTGANFPRFVIIEVQHANPFYDDSYAVDSANLGPYGTAIQRELIPAIEKQFRCIGQGWARFTYGGSTGGWEALAVQIFHPDDYNACFAACPDPIDFSAYTVVDIYKDQNAYYAEGDFARVPRPGMRNRFGHVQATLEQLNHLELVLGTHSRSGQQWDIWEAVFSPCGPDGYPARIWDKRSGVIDRQVAEYWREHYDLGHILQRDWATLGPKLEGKIHLYCGTMDNYYLNNAVQVVEAFLATTKTPAYGGEVDYGDRAEHCWNGDHTRPNALSRLRYNLMYVDKMLARMELTAPKGADLKSWRY
jgi:hypothetical protein